MCATFLFKCSFPMYVYEPNALDCYFRNLKNLPISPKYCMHVLLRCFAADFLAIDLISFLFFWPLFKFNFCFFQMLYHDYYYLFLFVFVCVKISHWMFQCFSIIFSISFGWHLCIIESGQ